MSMIILGFVFVFFTYIAVHSFIRIVEKASKKEDYSNDKRIAILSSCIIGGLLYTIIILF
jgi:amino acid transporter